MTLTLRPLSPEAFAPFGTVTVLAPGLTQGADPVRLVTEIENARATARLHVDFTTAAPSPLPLAARLFERHPSNSQSFIPLAVTRALILVAPAAPSGAPDLAAAQAFAAGGDQAVTYRAGVWHHPLTALDAPGFFVILTFRAGDDGDTVLFPLPTKLTIAA